MFGSKTREIARLRKATDDLTDLFNNKVDEVWKLGAANKEKDQAISNLKFQLQEAEDDKQDWIKDYQQLNDRYTLLDSLLKQLHVNVTLPVKKIARQN